MSQTKIEWAEKTWNPISGCTKISESCQHCYAERMSKRLAGRCGYEKHNPFRVTIHPDKISEPLRWRKPSRIFVCSMGDLFHEDVPFMEIAKIFGHMHTAYWHTYLLLTKRPKRMAEFLKWFVGPEWRGAWPNEYPHLWLGVTAENQARADERIPTLLQIPAAVRFVSIEPCLSDINLGPYLWDYYDQGSRRPLNKLHQVICGGETGPGARPMHPGWVRSLRDQCRAAGTPFFFKSWGDWINDLSRGLPLAPLPEFVNQIITTTEVEPNAGHKRFWAIDSAGKGTGMKRVGKKAAGRLLDGVEWNQYPEEAS